MKFLFNICYNNLSIIENNSNTNYQFRSPYIPEKVIVQKRPKLAYF